MLNLAIHAHAYQLSQGADNLLKRMLSPLCGLVQEIGFVRRSSREPKIIATGSDLTGAHVLLGKPNPGRGAYHIGANGIHFNEAIIKTLGESIERYSQLVAEVSLRFTGEFLPHSEMIKNNKHIVLPQNYLNLFSEEQYSRAGFPFELYADQPLTWIKLLELGGYKHLWVPAQLIFVGYQVKRAEAEPWLSVAVTTGTAAHTDKTKALINAILELIQIDSAVGHWYSSRCATRIHFDSRTQLLEKTLLQQGNFNHENYGFYWLENPDLAGFSVACVYRDSQKVIPHVAIGLGADMCLTTAMYKAYLEAVGVIGLSRMVVFQNNFLEKNSDKSNNDFYDLDTNVGHYALGNDFSLIQEKFPQDKKISASDLPPDTANNDAQQLQVLVQSFKKTHKGLFFCDLTCREASDLGFVAPRVWSPDTLSLCLPCAPWLKHPRFQAYGGVAYEFPHPYP